MRVSILEIDIYNHEVVNMVEMISNLLFGGLGDQVTYDEIP